MRTTLTLEDDVAKALEKEIRRSGESFKEGVNRILRLGLTATKAPVRKPFTIKPRKLGLPRGMSYDNVGRLIEELEGPSHR